jgi:chromosome segregation ATPase
MFILNLSLSVLEISLLCFGAIILGITIHFTITSRRNFRSSTSEKEEMNKLRDEWKLRYFNDMELKEKEIVLLKEQLTESEENTNIYSIEAEEMRKENKKLLAEVEEQANIYSIELEEMRKENKRLLAEVEEKNTVYSTEAEEIRKENKKLLAELSSTAQVIPVPAQLSEKPDYLEQLRLAQNSLMDHNEKIKQLLDNIDAFKEKEQKQREILKENEELSQQLTELRMRLSDKDREINDIRKKELLTKEMTSMLDNAYSEFNVLQSKMQKLELQANSSKMISMEYEDLKESHRRMSREFEEQKVKLSSLVSDHQQVQAQLMETEEKLREANFQRQQLQKRVAYLEELNNDLQAVSDANKKLEGQLKRIGELESMLNMAAEERNQLIRKVEK